MPGFQANDVAAISPDLFRSLMRNVASSVAVVTTVYQGRYHGMTATALASVTAEPPTILVVVNRSNRSHAAICGANNFIVNFIADNQPHLGAQFAGKEADQFAGVPYLPGWQEIPSLVGAAAHLGCAIVSNFEVGTHTIFIGRVVSGDSSGLPPLIYHDGSYKLVGDTVALQT